jgi:mono/diheme cytochrome c family protein
MRVNALTASGTTAGPRATLLRRAVAAVGRRTTVLALSALALPALGGCNIRQHMGLDMYDQAKVYKPYEVSDFFEDRQSSRPLVAGTVPRRETVFDRSGLGVEPVRYMGDAFPPDTLGKGDAVDPAQLKKVLERGQTKYNVYCAVCHGQTGLGDGMIAQRGFSPPPSFVVPNDAAAQESMRKNDPYRWQRTEALQTLPPRHIYNAITNGYGAMYSYADRVSDKDRWAIAAYIKALQSTPAEGPVPKPAATPSDKAAAR